MFLIRRSASQSGSRRLSALRLPLTVGLSLALVVPALTACQEGGTDTSSSSQPSSSSDSSRSSASGGGTSKASDKSSDTGKKGAVDNAAYLEFPEPPSGWEMTIRDKDGMDQMKNSAGCLLTASNDLLTTDVEDDRQNTEDVTNQFIDSYEQDTRFTNISFEPSQDDFSTIKDTDGNTIETKRADWTYEDSSHARYQGTIFVRAFSTTQTKVALRVMYACPADAYSSSEMETLMGKTLVNHPGPADMDEGASSSSSNKGNEDKEKGKKSGSEDGTSTAPGDKNDKKDSGSSSKDT